MTRQPSLTKPVIGIVGGIGAGKSTVAAEFAALGCVLIDADAIGHELLDEDDVRHQVRRRWGPGVFDDDGRVRRGELAARVFADPAELDELNRILHPRIRRQLAERIDAAMAAPGAAGAVVDAAVLFEAGWDDLCSHVVFVAADDPMRLQRVRRQRGWDRQMWQEREKSQISLDKKQAECDYTLDNRPSASLLREQVRQLFHRICCAD